MRTTHRVGTSRRTVIAATLAAALTLFACAAAPAHAETRTSDIVLGKTVEARRIDMSEMPDISAPHAIVLGQDGAAYFERQADDPIKIASVTKVMTALVALEHCKLTDTVAVDRAAATVGESSLGLLEGDTLTMEDALTGLMVMSGNDVATAIATTAGSKIDPESVDPYAVFIDAMNAKAAELGCEDSVFENPHGLDFDDWAGDLHSTASDVARIFAAAMENEDFRAIDDSDRTSVPVTSADGSPRTINLIVRNKIHGQDGNIGGKTGTTGQAGNCFVGAFNREPGGEIYVAVFGAESDGARFADTLALANWYYGHMATVPFLNTPATRNGTPLVGEAACTAWCDRAAAVTLQDAGSTCAVFSLGGPLEQSVDFDEPSGAVKVGDAMGTLQLEQDGKAIGRTELVAAESVPAPNPFEWLMVKFDRLVRLIESKPRTAESIVLNETPNPTLLDAWGA